MNFHIFTCILGLFTHFILYLYKSHNNLFFEAIPQQVVNIKSIPRFQIFP